MNTFLVHLLSALQVNFHRTKTTFGTFVDLKIIQKSNRVVAWQDEMRYTTLEEAMVGSSSSAHAPQQYTSLAILQKGGQNTGFRKRNLAEFFMLQIPYLLTRFMEPMNRFPALAGLYDNLI
jgi:hypothetical protein